MYSPRQLKREASLTPTDLVEAGKCRRPQNRLGFAYQLGFVRLLNHFPRQQAFEIVEDLVNFTAVQVGVDAALIDLYRKRQQTISEHQRAIASYMGLRNFGDTEVALLETFVFEESCRLEQTAALQARAREFLKEQRILEPAESRITRIVGEQRKAASEHIFRRITADIPKDLAHTLDGLLVIKTDESVSALQRIKANPSKPSAEAMLALLKKLAMIEATGVLGVDLTWLNSNYQRALFHQVRKSSAHRIRELFAPSRRQAALVCFLWQSYRDSVDQAVDMFDKLLTRTNTRAQNELDEQLRRQRQTIQVSLAAFGSLGRVILDNSISDGELRARLFAAVPREELAACMEEMDEWVAGKRTDPFYGVVRRHGLLRKFSPALLDALEFAQDAEGAPTACLRALRILKEMNATGRRKLPEDSPTGFLPQRLKPIVMNHGEIDRRAWECALLLKLRDELKAGNLSVRYSKRFARLDDFFIDDHRWQGMREDFFRRSGLPCELRQVPNYLAHRLGEAYDRFLKTAPINSYVVVEDEGWRLSAEPTEKLDQEAQERLAHLKSWLTKNMRRTRLPDLLIEVDNELGFTCNFLTPARRGESSPEDICAVLAAVMAHGCNLGAYTMAQLTLDVSYEQLKRIGDWQLTEEAQRSALAALVDAIAGLDTSSRWGEGRTSASDGQRFSLPRRILQQTYSTRFSDFALEFYTFVADNYAPFYSLPIECTDRDAAFVLDGLLYNESDLPLEEHYTDTHGYTEINFAAFAMLGRRFCPRIRGVQHQRIYRIEPNRDYGVLKGLVGRTDQTIDTELIAEQWDRMGQLYASLQTGHVTASVALRRLVGYGGKNRFYRANRDLGRILKTEFILQYLSEPELRGRIRRGLLKVEQLHALARDVFYGRRGRINARELWEQMNTCSCLTLILACIVYWQAREISRVLSQCDPVANGVDLSLLEHVSPIEWDNVVLYGQYILDRKLVRRRRESVRTFLSV
jgi:TnpA family transposase/predicted transcriptional regulator